MLAPSVRLGYFKIQSRSDASRSNFENDAFPLRPAVRSRADAVCSTCTLTGLWLDALVFASFAWRQPVQRWSTGEQFLSPRHVQQHSCGWVRAMRAVEIKHRRSRGVASANYRRRTHLKQSSASRGRAIASIDAPQAGCAVEMSDARIVGGHIHSQSPDRRRTGSAAARARKFVDVFENEPRYLKLENQAASPRAICAATCAGRAIESSKRPSDVRVEGQRGGGTGPICTTFEAMHVGQFGIARHR